MSEKCSFLKFLEPLPFVHTKVLKHCASAGPGAPFGDVDVEERPLPNCVGLVPK